jgi:hypothetical protein
MRCRCWPAEAVPPRMGLRTMYLAGTATRLQAGDALLMIGDERSQGPRQRKLGFPPCCPPARSPAGDPSDPKDIGYTVVTLDRGLGKPYRGVPSTARTNPRCYALRARAHLFGYNAPDWRAMPANLRATFLRHGRRRQATDQPNIRNGLASRWPIFPIRRHCCVSGSGLFGNTTGARASEKRF